MHNLLRVLIVLGAAQLGVVSSSNAQATWPFNGAGSSAVYLEGGEGAASQLAATIPGGDTFQCLWTAKSGATTGLSAVDGSTGVTENGQSWVAWSIDTTTSGVTDCSTPGNSPVVYTYEQTDSVVGNRLLFNASTITLGASFAATAKLAYTSTCSATGWDTTANPTAPVETCSLPTAISNLLTAGSVQTVAGTDIRPEDAAFATLRVGGTGCNTAVAGSQYLGLGYGFETSGTSLVQIKSAFTGSPFNVTNFTLPSSYSVFRFGAAPVVVHVNQVDGTALGAGAAGFADTNITNVTSGVLANILDGTYARTGDFPNASGTSEGITVLVREPLSGTYNTMEYNIPNNVELQTSQDVGVNQVDISAPLSDGRYNRNCNATHTGPEWNASGVAMGTLIGNPKERAIGTGQELSDTFGASTNALGYAFWSASNFKNANAGGVTTNKYLTVDGVDPLGTGTAGVGGGIPTSATALANVTLAHVADGTYPIWSLLRLVSAGSTTAPSAVTNLAEAAQAYVTASNPDFVPYDLVPAGSIPNLAVERAHFTPPGIYASGSQPTLQNGIGGLFTEAGGDVGGLPIPYQADTDYCAAYSSGTCTAGHSFTSTQAPSSS